MTYMGGEMAANEMSAATLLASVAATAEGEAASENWAQCCLCDTWHVVPSDFDADALLDDWDCRGTVLWGGSLGCRGYGMDYNGGEVDYSLIMNGSVGRKRRSSASSSSAEEGAAGHWQGHPDASGRSGNCGKGQSMYRGVCRVTQSRKENTGRDDRARTSWRVAFKYRRRAYYVGVFEDEVDAGRAYDCRVLEVKGIEADTNVRLPLPAPSFPDRRPSPICTHTRSICHWQP